METRIIVAGSRTFSDYPYLKSKIESYITKHKDHRFVIVSGNANGADKLGERFAFENGIELRKFPAQWNLYGSQAGYLRNNQMINFAKESPGDAVLMAFWDGKSKGTKQMIKSAKKAGIQVCIFTEE